MNDSNKPKPLPDDFGMTIPNLRLPKQNQSSSSNESDLPTTNLRSAPPPKQNPYAPQQPPPAPNDDFGMTIPNLGAANKKQPPKQPMDNFDMTMPNMRQPQKPPSEPDFGMTLNNFQPKSSAEEPDFGATMSYIPMPTKQQRAHQEEFREELPPPVATPVEQRKEQRKGIPAWLLVLVGVFAFLGLLIVGGVAAYFLIPRESGFALTLKGAPPGSTVFVDGTRRGVTSGDGSVKILGIKADEKRALKVSKDGCTDFNDTIIGANGDVKELVVQMRCGVAPPPPPKGDCNKDCADDPRVCKAECEAEAALDKLTPPFTVDQWVAAMNLQVINFDNNSADVPPARKRLLEKGAEKFKLITGNPGVEIGGHTDNVGGDASNQKLSESRAQAVRFILVNNDVNPKAFTTRGFDSNKQKTSNDTPEGNF